MARRPDLFIIGAAKSGTTSLYEYLRGHPEVFMSTLKEPVYFSPDLLARGERRALHYGRDRERYLALFADARDEKRVGEATPRYIYSQAAPQLIREFEPNAYIIAMLRNPIDMMHSLHGHHVAAGWETILDFEAALEAEAERRRSGGKKMRMLLYRERASYATQLARWFELFPRDRIHVIVFEEFASDPASSFRSVLEFIGVDASYRPASFEVYNPRYEPRVRLLRRAFRAAPAHVLIWRTLPLFIGEARTKKLVRRVGGLNRKPIERRPVPPELRLQLQAELADDVGRLSELLGRDMAELWWGRAPAQRADVAAASVS